MKNPYNIQFSVDKSFKFQPLGEEGLRNRKYTITKYLNVPKVLFGYKQVHYWPFKQ